LDEVIAGFQKGQAMKTLFIALRTAIFGTGFIFLWGWVALSLHHRYDISLGIGLSDWMQTPGIVLMVLGGTLAFACVATFVIRGEGTPAPFDPPRNFVAAGPYEHVRNPMYIGGFAVLVGFGLYEQSVAILLFTLPWLLSAHLFVILYEEPHLRSAFGTPYDAYCRSVRRWLPLPGRRNRLPICCSFGFESCSPFLCFHSFLASSNCR
jgi:protein-S-isoprenylcysteine O-methyltransferase Ste14